MKWDAKSDIEKSFADQVLRYRLPHYEREYQFALDVKRKWRLDFYFPEYRLAVELHGLIVVNGPMGNGIVRGGHATPKGMRNDMDKLNAMAILKITPLVFSQSHVDNGDAIAVTQRALVVKGWKR